MLNQDYLLLVNQFTIPKKQNQIRSLLNMNNYFKYFMNKNVNNITNNLNNGCDCSIKQVKKIL